MKKTSLLISFFVISNLLLGQFRSIDYTPVALIPQGYSINSLSSYGVSNILNSQNNIAFMNPAALSDFNKLSIGASYQHEGKLEDAWLVGIGGERVKNNMPQSAGLLVPYKNFRLGLSAGQLYNYQLNLGKIEYTTPQEPGGTRKFYTVDYRSRIYSYSILSSYNFNNIFSNDILSVGAKINLNRLYHYEDIAEWYIEDTFNQYNFNAGLTYQKNLSENKFYKVGLAYTSPIEFSGNAKRNFNRNDTLLYPAGYLNNNNSVLVVFPDFNLKAWVPGQFNLDFILKKWDKTQISGGMNYIYYNNFNSNSSNRIETFANLNHEIISNLNVSFGFFTTGFNFKEDFDNINDDLKGRYLTLGSSYKFKFIKVDAAFANGTLLSGSAYKNNVAKIGLSFIL